MTIMTDYFRGTVSVWMVQDLFATVASLRAALLPVDHPSSNLTEVSNIGCRHCEAVRTGQQPNRRSSETVRTILRAFCNSGASSKLLVYIHHLDPFGAICSSCSSCPVYCQLLLKTKVNDVWTASLPDLVWRELPAAPWEARAGFQACPACLLACLPCTLEDLQCAFQIQNRSRTVWFIDFYVHFDSSAANSEILCLAATLTPGPRLWHGSQTRVARHQQYPIEFRPRCIPRLPRKFIFLEVVWKGGTSRTMSPA